MWWYICCHVASQTKALSNPSQADGKCWVSWGLDVAPPQLSRAFCCYVGNGHKTQPNAWYDNYCDLAFLRVMSVTITYIGTNISEQSRPIVLASHHVIGSVESQMACIMDACNDPLPLLSILHCQSWSYRWWCFGCVCRTYRVPLFNIMN